MLSAKVVRKVKQGWPGYLEKAADRFLDDAGPFMEDEVKERVPRKTGQLINSINHRRKGSVVTVGTNVEYATHVEYGTQPHQITVNGPVKFKDGWRYLTTVQHPGTEAQPYMRPAIDDNRRRLTLMFRDALRAVFRGR